MYTHIVVGAGILGASAAYHLAKAGAQVAIVDRQDLGRATRAAGGMICPWLSQRRNKAWYKLAKAGARYYPELIRQLADAGENVTSYKRVGAISLHTDAEKLDKLEKIARTRLADAPEIGEITRLSPAETKKLFPPLAEPYGSIHVSGAARVNADALRRALVRAARKCGATVLQGDASLVRKGGRVTGVQVAGRMLPADQVILTAGAWGKQLLEPLGIHFRVSGQKAQIIHLQMPGADTGAWPVVLPPTDQHILAFDHGRIVIGATHENDTGFDTRVTAGGVQEILAKALAVAPGLSNSTMLAARVGFRPYTPGFLPAIGRLPGYETVLLANGIGASGLTVGPYLGVELAKLALGKPTEISLGDYDIAGALD
ncbi:MAG TPA: FAD-dependent oxidoreductase [Bacilli bacterium]